MESKYIYKYLGAIAVIGLASYYGNRIKQGLANKDENDEREACTHGRRDFRNQRKSLTRTHLFIVRIQSAKREIRVSHNHTPKRG